MYKVGAARTDITLFCKDVVMLGYGRPFHKIKDVETPIHSRTIIIESQGKKICFVNLEVGFCTIYLKNGVVEKLKRDFPEFGLDDSNVMITAQHTHSAPGGFGQHFTYNIPTPGFRKDVWKHFRDGIVQSIITAHIKMKPAKIKFDTGFFDEKDEIAFNRSLDAYNTNPEVKKKLKKEDWHLACDREMKLMNFENEKGRVIASLNWFGIHCTSVSNDKYKICADNKGYASTYMEEHFENLYGDENTVCIFAQDACADVSPNFIFDIRKQWTRGKYKDDYESAKFNGDLQFQKARSISDSIKKSKNLPERLEYIQTYVDFSSMICDPEFTNGQKDCRTSGACLGVSFLEGTVEGPGLAKPFGVFLKTALDIHKKNELKWATEENRPESFKEYIRLKYETQSPKHIAIEAGKGKFAWLDHGGQIPIPGIIEKTIDYIKNAVKQRKNVHKPWIISKLPIQIFILGPMAIVGIPTEISVIAAERLRKTIMDGLGSYGVERVQLSPYANAYAGYVTTPEEYMLQKYEGGHTLFGKWTLPALQTSCKRLMDKLKKGEEDTTTPLIFSEDQIWVYR